MSPQQSRAGLPSVATATAEDRGDRPLQEDRVAIFTQSHPWCLMAVVADGRGGQSGKHDIAEDVLLCARQHFEGFHPGRDNPVEILDAIVSEAHTIVHLHAMTTASTPHSTVAMLLAQPDRVDWCHVGDTRIYHIRDRRLHHVSTDHSYAQEAIRSGRLKPDRAHLHPAARQLVNALGTNRTPTATHGHLDAPRDGDNFLLCTDGIWEYFHAGELVLALVQGQEDLDQTARTILGRARERAAGAGDNCAAALVRWLPTSSRPHRV